MNKTGLFLLLAGTAALLFPLRAIAADEAGRNGNAPLIARVQAVYADLESFRAEFIQNLTHQESGVTESRRGTLLFRKPLLVRWETAEPQPELLLITEREIWNYLPDEDLAYRYSLELARDSHSIITVITGRSPLDQDFDIERQADEDGLVFLLLYPKEPTAQMTEAQVWVDPATFFIRRAVIMDFYGNTNEVAFTRFDPGAPVAPEELAFTPPAGTEVEDHTDDSQIMELPLFD